MCTLSKVTQMRLCKHLTLFQDSQVTWLGLHLIAISLLRWAQIPSSWGWNVHFIHLIDCLFIQVSWEEAKWFWIYLLNSICYPLCLCHVPSCLSSSKLNSPNLFTLSSFRSLFTSPQISIIPVQALLFLLFPFWDSNENWTQRKVFITMSF